MAQFDPLPSLEALGSEFHRVFSQVAHEHQDFNGDVIYAETLRILWNRQRFMFPKEADHLVESHGAVDRANRASAEKERSEARRLCAEAESRVRRQLEEDLRSAAMNGNLKIGKGIRAGLLWAADRIKT